MFLRRGFDYQWFMKLALELTNNLVEITISCFLLKKAGEFIANKQLLMQKLLITLLFFLFGAQLIAATDDPSIPVYRYSVDLNQVENDRLKIELTVPKLKTSRTVFYLPKIVPGTYSNYNFGRFVSEFKAYDANGKEMPTQRLDINSWKIDDARNLSRISYLVDDSDDAGVENPVFGMSGTNIEANENFIINTHGFFGYFKGMKELPFQVQFSHPDGFYGSTALNPTEKSPDYTTYLAKDYHLLVDSPIMFSRPDTATIQVGNAEVLISVHSPEDDFNAKMMADQLKGLLKATHDYFGGKLPVDRYAFIYYFRDPNLMQVGTGALEHSHSSLYYMPYYPPQFILPVLRDISAHEFFHILTPLNIHSEEIHYFDFNKPEMSQHLWLYEGVTEYFAHHVQVNQGLNTPEEFIGKMQAKIVNSQRQYNDNLAFTKLSKESLGQHQHEYGNVYEKGALIGMCLDIELRRLSNEKYGLLHLMQDLSQKFGKDQPFKDKKLFKEIVKLTFPEIGDFFKTYVAGDTPLPYERIMEQVGIKYIPSESYKDFSLGHINLAISEEGNIVVAGIGQMDAMGKALGYQVGDEIMKINGQAIPGQARQQFFNAIKEGFQEGQPVEVEIRRADETGEPQTRLLKANAIKVEKRSDPQLELMEEVTEGQKNLRKAWLVGNE